MTKKLLLRTNLIICIIILLGAAATLLLGQRSIRTFYIRDITDTTMLVANSISAKIDSTLSPPDGSREDAPPTTADISVLAAHLRPLFQGYYTDYGVTAYLVDSTGELLLSAEAAVGEPTAFFPGRLYAGAQSAVLASRKEPYAEWYSIRRENGYLVSIYNPNFDWHLVVDNNTTVRSQQIAMSFLENGLIALCTVALVLALTTRMMRRYTARISELTVAPELEYHRLLLSATEGLYDNIFEWNISKNQVSGESTRAYLREQLLMDPDISYDDAIRIIASKQFHPNFIQGYLDKFSSARVLATYAEGVNSISYEAMTLSDCGESHWMRITARIFFWPSDHTLRLISYRKNIDAEKQREATLLERSQRDSLTGLLNKQATEEQVTLALAAAAEANTKCAFLIFDVDDFKTVNDNLGHAAGDRVLTEFAKRLQAHFPDASVIGRIGGDEFVVVFPELSGGGTQERLTRFLESLKSDSAMVPACAFSTSVGVAFFPEHGMAYAELYENADQALYFSKGHGKSCYHIHGGCSEENAPSRLTLRDMEGLLHSATDGLSKIACLNGSMRILYFNARRAELTGTPPQAWSTQDYNMLEQVHPDDVERVRAAIEQAIPTRSPFRVTYRILHEDGHPIPVLLRAMFTPELYDNRYPVFYAAFINLSEAAN